MGVIAWEELGNVEDKVGSTRDQVDEINTEGEGTQRPKQAPGEEIFLTKTLSKLLASLGGSDALNRIYLCVE